MLQKLSSTCGKVGSQLIIWTEKCFTLGRVATGKYGVSFEPRDLGFCHADAHVRNSSGRARAGRMTSNEYIRSRILIAWLEVLLVFEPPGCDFFPVINQSGPGDSHNGARSASLGTSLDESKSVASNNFTFRLSSTLSIPNSESELCA